MDDQSAVIAFLADPSSYGPGVEAVERIDTHISVVFLAGDRVFKLKRAVDLPFLDYGSPDKRRLSCAREIALNRRTAPDLYLGLRAVTRQPDGTFTFDGEGEVLDWVVEMVRFDADGLFDRRAAAGRLDAAAVDGAVDSVTALHRDAEVVDVPADWLSGTVEELLESLPRFPDVLYADAVARYSTQLQRAYEDARPLLAARAEAGHVRACHGDLHLANICTFGCRATLFDAAEANDSFMQIDVLYDLAFLLMDLGHRGLGALANTALNRYVASAFDPLAVLDGLAALPLFLSLRAAIRARVAALTVANAPDVPAAAECRDNARRYLEQAEGLLAPPPAMLVAVGGPSGTGKSTLAFGLAPGIGACPGAIVVRADTVRKFLFDVPETTRLRDAAYTSEWHARTYDAVFERARRTLAAGHACIVDGVNGRPKDRDALRRLADATGVSFTGLWLDAPADVLRARVEGRHGDASDADATILEHQLEQGFGKVDWVRLGASGPPDEVLAEACAVLSRATQK